MKKTSEYLKQKKACGEKITMLTCYDYPTALWEEEAGVDIMLVGDSVGTNVLGYESEREVTMDDMVHHLKAVRRGVKDAYLLVDLPYMSCDTPDQALENARIFLDCGADGVKLEGAKVNVVRSLVEHGVEVCGHLGYNPQIHGQTRMQAKTAQAAVDLLRDASEIEAVGAWSLVLEMVPEEVAKVVSEKLAIPTIGIGAGRYTDGQVLVVPDLLGVNAFEFRHSAKYEDFNSRALEAIGRYVENVRNGQFPTEANARHLAPEEMEALEQLLQHN